MPDALLRPNSIGNRAGVLPPAFVCSRTDGRREAVWVHVAGELDIAAAPQLEGTLAIDDLQARLVVLDLRDLSFVDSSGVHAIAKASRRAREAGRRLVVVRGPPRVDRLFTLTGSSGDVEIADLDPGDPPVRGLPELAHRDPASRVDVHGPPRGDATHDP